MALAVYTGISPLASGKGAVYTGISPSASGKVAVYTGISPLASGKEAVYTGISPSASGNGAMYTGISPSSSGKEVNLKISYGGCMRRLKYQRKELNGFLVWSPDLSFETLHFRIEELFQISERFLVTFTDIDNDVITMSNTDDVRDVIEGQSICCSMNSVHLGVSLIDPQSRIVGGAPCGQLVNVGDCILPASKYDRNSVMYTFKGRCFREQMRVLSYNMLLNPKLNGCEYTNMVSTTKLAKLYEASTYSSSPTQIPVDLIENLLNRITLTFPDLVALRVFIQ